MKKLWGLILTICGLGLTVYYFVTKSYTPSGPFIDFINTLFPYAVNSPGQDLQIISRISKIWQIAFLLPGILFLGIGLSLVLSWDSRCFLKRIIGFLPTPVFLMLCSILFFAAAAWVAEVPLDGIPHTGDDINQVFQAKILAKGHLVAPAPDSNILPSFLSEHIVVRNGSWFAMYPIGHALLLVPFVWTKLVALAGPFFGVLRLLLLYAIARLFLNQNSSRLAVLLCLLSPFAYLISSSPVYHNTDLLLTMIFLWGFFRSRQNLSWLPALMAGLAIGYSPNVRPTLPIILCASALTFLIWDLWHHHRKDALWRGVWLAVGIIPGILLLMWVNYLQNGSPLLLGYEIQYPGQAFGFGADKNYISLYGIPGHTPLKALFNLSGNLLALSSTLHGWPLISLVPAIWGLWVGRKKLANWLLASICLYTAIVQAFHLGSGIVLGPRHYFVCLASLLILGTQGLVWLYKKGRRTALALTLILAFLTIQTFTIYVPNVLSILSVSYLGVDDKVIKAAEYKAQRPAVVFIRGYIKGYYNYQSGFLANSPWLDDQIIYALELDTAQNQKVIAAYPNRNVYVFICPKINDPGKLYPYNEAPPQKPGDFTEYEAYSSNKSLDL